MDLFQFVLMNNHLTIVYNHIKNVNLLIIIVQILDQIYLYM